jgi:FAD/FMN-containing dehydrogenase
MHIKSALQKAIKGEVIDTSEILDAFSKDASIFVLKPALVIAPKDKEDIENLVKFVNDHPEIELSLTPRSAGTCMSGGPLSESLVLDMTKYFDQVKKVGEDYAVTEPGVFYRNFEKETLKKNLLLPCYTSSRELNTVGGMVGNNSAGEKTLSYGQTERWVKELKVVLADGEEHEIKPLTKKELEVKIKEKSFEGDLYRQIFNLIERNYDLIQKHQPQTSKNSTGYYLWKVWDKEKEIFDLNKLIVGSQGTLGVVTEITFQLIKPKTQKAMVEIELGSLDQLDKVVLDILQFNPESFECFDNQTIKFSYKFIPDFKKDFKKHNSDPIQLKLLPGFMRGLFRKLPKIVLIAEFTGDSEEEVTGQATKANESLKKFSQITSRVVKSADEDKYWILRRDSFNILRHHSGKTLRTAPFIDDIVVQVEKLPAFLPRLQQVLSPYRKKIIYTIAGHIGNGNFHIIPLMDMHKKEIRDLVPEISKKVFDLVFEFGGSMAAEHNDGLVRGPYLEKMYGIEMFQLFKAVKKIFDPKNIFNPHKKSQATWEYSHSHLSGEGITVKDYAQKTH